MKKKITIMAGILFIAVMASSVLFSASVDTRKWEAYEPITVEKMRLLPIPPDYRNYFFLQAINDTTYVVIGDFVGNEKKFCMIEDIKSDEKIDKVTEFMPDTNKFVNLEKPTTSFFTTLPEVKDKILSGEIFRSNYSYNMTSIPVLKGLLKRGRDIIKVNYGYTVKLYDPDHPDSMMSEFYFGKNPDGRYDLVLTTHYYKIFMTKITPPIACFVYCKNTKDPVIAETVESLLKLVPQGIAPEK